MKDNIERMETFRRIDEFFKNNEITKNLTREERILKLSKPLTVIVMNMPRGK